jgi:hypothetical protein
MWTSFRTRAIGAFTIALTLLLYAGAIIAAIALRGRIQAFAIGFAMIGGLYFATLASKTLSEYLLTNRISALVWNQMWSTNVLIPTNADELSATSEFSGIRPVVAILVAANEGSNPYNSRMFAPPSVFSRSVCAFFLIGHCVWSWLFALLGGWFASSMYAKRNSSNAS